VTLNMRQSCLGTVTALKSLGVGLVPGSMSFSYFESANIVAVTAGAGLEMSHWLRKFRIFNLIQFCRGTVENPEL
jgi:hypothetical protein